MAIPPAVLAVSRTRHPAVNRPSRRASERRHPRRVSLRRPWRRSTTISARASARRLDLHRKTCVAAGAAVGRARGTRVAALDGSRAAARRVHARATPGAVGPAGRGQPRESAGRGEDARRARTQRSCRRRTDERRSRSSNAGGRTVVLDGRADARHERIRSDRRHPVRAKRAALPASNHRDDGTCHGRRPRTLPCSGDGRVHHETVSTATLIEAVESLGEIEY